MGPNVLRCNLESGREPTKKHKVSCFPSHKPLLSIIAESLIFAVSNRFRMFIDDFGGFDENQSHVAGDVDFLQF